jgi:hypothetical protein
LLGVCLSVCLLGDGATSPACGAGLLHAPDLPRAHGPMACKIQRLCLLPFLRIAGC